VKKSPMRLLSVAAAVMAFGLTVAPASFAGEDGEPGPTQVGEVQAPVQMQSPAASPGPSSSTTRSSSKSHSSHAVAGVQTSLQKSDTVRARGGIQTGVGGMAVASTEGKTLAVALAGGGILLLVAAGSGLVPLRRRSEG
jgi:hypothetical protein